MKLIIPKGYVPKMDAKTTHGAIERIKDEFRGALLENLNLVRASHAVVLPAGTGVNDDLNGIEKPVEFATPDGVKWQLPQSLAKWKRQALADYGYKPGEGIWTDMTAVRPDDSRGHFHSVYVDQWDWEKVMAPEERTIEFLKATVRKIYAAIKRTAATVEGKYDLSVGLAPEITFITTEELHKAYPKISGSKALENEIVREARSVFLIGIGYPLRNGEPDLEGQPHDGRAPDYDDWSTPNSLGGRGLNGDILVWNPLFEMALELSSMGIRVNRESLVEQCRIRGSEDRLELEFHKRLLNGELPQTIGGGVGQSRLSMLLLQKAHIGEVQVGAWPADMRRELAEHGISLL
ncbi:aspartate--ammonia ligase [Candidatus Micrarchaeota archaeon]|nr:aspartate--ammonia ligase [Candidatus Micrarchaeota archaeon]